MFIYECDLYVPIHKHIFLHSRVWLYSVLEDKCQTTLEISCKIHTTTSNEWVPLASYSGGTFPLLVNRDDDSSQILEMFRKASDCCSH